MNKEYETNFNAMSIILATLDSCPNEPLFPEPRQIRAEEIWPDYMIDWLPTKKWADYIATKEEQTNDK